MNTESSPTPYDIIAPQSYPFALSSSMLALCFGGILLVLFIFLYYRTNEKRHLPYHSIQSQLQQLIFPFLHGNIDRADLAPLHLQLTRYLSYTMHDDEKAAYAIRELQKIREEQPDKALTVEILMILDQVRYAEQVEPTRLRELQEKLSRFLEALS